MMCMIFGPCSTSASKTPSSILRDNSYDGSTGKKMPSNAQALTERDGLYISLNISFSGEPLFIIKNNITKISKILLKQNN
jgi:hypothetical protein